MAAHWHLQRTSDPKAEQGGWNKSLNYPQPSQDSKYLCKWRPKGQLCQPVDIGKISSSWISERYSLWNSKWLWNYLLLCSPLIPYTRSKCPQVHRERERTCVSYESPTSALWYMKEYVRTRIFSSPVKHPFRQPCNETFRSVTHKTKFPCQDYPGTHWSMKMAMWVFQWF